MQLMLRHPNAEEAGYSNDRSPHPRSLHAISLREQHGDFPTIRSEVNTDPPYLREVTRRIAEVNGVNLGQGVCLLPTPECVKQGKIAAVDEGKNQYAPAAGIEPLRTVIARKFQNFNRAPYETRQVLVTDGATGAFEVVCRGFLSPGDGVIVLRPSYPYHAKCIQSYGAHAQYVDMRGENWEFSDRDLEAALTARTKFLLLNTPGNPTGKVFSASEIRRIADFCTANKILCVTDETYEHVVYAGQKHISIASLPEMAECTITISSFSKVFAITGWRVGYLGSPGRYVEALRGLFDQRAICAPTDAQYGVLAGLEQLGDEYYAGMLADYTRKRDILSKGLRDAGFEVRLPQGAYYLLAPTAGLFPDLFSENVCNELIDRIGVGSVPAIDFLGDEVRGDPARSNFLRFCYAMSDEVLIKACERLRLLRS